MFKKHALFVVVALVGAAMLSVSCKKTVTPPSMTAFSFKASDNAVLSEDYVGTIVGQNINIALPDVDKSSLVATFTVGEGNIVKVNGAVQTSGKSANDFSAGAIYVVTDENGENPVSYVVVVSLAPDKHPALLNFSFEAEKNTAALAKTLNGQYKGTEIGVDVPQLADVTSLVASFTTGTGNKVTVNGVEQVSGVTVNDFSSPVDYLVTNLDGSVNAMYSVTLNRQKGEWKVGTKFDAIRVFAGARIIVNPLDDVPYVAFKRFQPLEVADRDDEKDEKMYAMKLVNGAWEMIGEAFSDKVNGSDYDFSISPSGTPFIAFSNSSISPKVTTVMKYSDGAWSVVGGNVGTGATSKTHLHAIADDKLVVSQLISRKVVVGIWNGSSWSTSNIIADNPNSYEIRMAGDNANAYVFSINRGKINNVNYGHNVMKYNGTDWSALRSNYLREGASQTSITAFDLTMAPDGTLYLMTADNAEDAEKYHCRVEKYNEDGTWSQVGSTLDFVVSTTDCFARIAVAPDGTPFVAYPNVNTDPKSIEVVYFDSEAKQWSAPVTLQGGTGAYVGNPNLSITFDSKGKGYLTWCEGNALIINTFE